MDVLISRVIREEPTPGKTLGSRGHSIVLILDGLTPHLTARIRKESDLPGHPPQIYNIWDSS